MEQNENNHLLNKIININCGKTDYPWHRTSSLAGYARYKKSLNIVNDKKEKKRILHENNAMALRIKSQSATISKSEQIKESEKYLYL